jgi:hypothetical protein
MTRLFRLFRLFRAITVGVERVEFWLLRRNLPPVEGPRCHSARCTLPPHRGLHLVTAEGWPVEEWSE